MSCDVANLFARRSVRALSRSDVAMMIVAGAVIAPLGCGLDFAGGSDLNQESVLSLFAPPSPSEVARWAADPYDPDKRQRGLTLLANAQWGGAPAYLRFYRTSVEDTDPAVRATACMALGRHGEPADAALLIARLTDEKPIVRRAAARALQRIHDPAAIRPLLRAADARLEDDPETRAAAATALGQYADERVVQGLIATLRDRRLLVNEAAKDSLAVLTGQDFGYDPNAWLAWTSQTDDVFAGRGRYLHPAYRRAPRFWEQFIPWLQPPNETASVPVGMASQQKPSEQTPGG